MTIGPSLIVVLMITTGEMNEAEHVLRASTLQAAIAWCEAQCPEQAVVIFGANWFHSGLPRPLVVHSYEDERITAALDFAFRYGQIDGDHHKTWVIDQMVRSLTGEKYEAWVIEACDGVDGPDTYEWDEGIPP